MPNSIEVLEVKVPVERIRALTREQRYTYYLLGFIYNELMSLRKMIAFALQQAQVDERRVKMNAEMSQVLLLFRIACAKVWEAHQKLNSREVSNVISSDVFPVWPEGPQVRKQMNKLVSETSWLNDLRNSLGFHYPSMSQWDQVTTPDETWEDDLLYFGNETGNTFYDAAEVVAKHHMFGGRARDPKQSRKMVDEMIDVLGVMTDYVEQALGMFVVTVLITALPNGPRHRLSAPKYDQIRLPFWTEMTAAKRQVTRKR